MFAVDGEAVIGNVSVPGDGEFTVPADPEAIMLLSAKLIATSSTAWPTHEPAGF